jgi:23S rRNA-/tRNA-specific pseudouridylate synthase
LRSHLASISIGRRFKQKRKTILKQIDRVNMRLADIHTDPAETVSVRKTCRNCGDIGCSGRCWGFYGLKRKERLENLYEQKPSVKVPRSRPENKPPCVSNKLQKDTNLFLAPPNCFRDERSEIRIPPCMTRILSCQTKAKWCGHSVLNVVQREFIELSKPVVLNEVISNGLLRLNGQPLSLIEASETQLKSSDSISRVIHWHEAPIEIPGPMIQVQRHVMPRHIMCEYNAIDDDEGLLFVCNKPSTVPVHPSGPYLLNTLAIMVEAQEKLEPLSLNPLHRTDRVTSGITICSPSPAVSRVFHRSLSAANVHKLYLAKVHGCFPASNTETEQLCVDKAIGRVSWSTPSDGVAVDAPIHTIDAANGHRIVDAHGKASQSIFRLLEYHCETDTSLISCYPITGRNHQLRVHLQWLGFPIVNDVKYGGRVQAEISKKYDALSLMMDVSNSAKEERKVDAVSDDDVVAAKRACACCRGMEGLMDSFTPAQLLEQGHKIFLHALRYRILVLPRKKKTANDDESIQSLAELSFEVDPPTWVNKDALQQSDLDEYWRSIRNSFD